MSDTAHRENILITTPHGHAVTVDIDYDEFAVRHAKVVNQYTGVIKALDPSTSDILARALQAKRVYEQALAEVRQVERTLKGFGSLAEALGRDHPALNPYLQDAERHKAIARDMFMQARHFHEDAMAAIDRLADKADQ